MRLDRSRTSQPQVVGGWTPLIRSKKQEKKHCICSASLFGADYLGRKFALFRSLTSTFPLRENVAPKMVPTVSSFLLPFPHFGAVRATEKPASKKKKHCIRSASLFGADYGARTRHLHLGKVALYQMS